MSLEMIRMKMKQLENDTLLRSLATNDGVDFTSNDYLGLSDHPGIRASILQSLESGAPLGSTGSRLLRGNTSWHSALETKLANFKKAPAALIFNTGFDANYGILTSFASDKTVFFSDENNHASIIDGIRASRCEKHIYRHGDARHLRELLKTHGEDKYPIIVTESLFSMDGDFAPLEKIIKLAKTFGARLIVDEAHATGMFGPTGAGLTEGLNYDELDLITLHTCGKALGSFGAFVCCSEEMKTFLINSCRAFIYTTALPPYVMSQWHKTIEVVQAESWRREHVLKVSRCFKEKIGGRLEVGETNSPIVPVFFASIPELMKTCAAVRERGFDVRPIRYPTVPLDRPRLRITFNVNHSEELVTDLAQALLEETSA